MDLGHAHFKSLLGTTQLQVLKSSNNRYLFDTTKTLDQTTLIGEASGKRYLSLDGIGYHLDGKTLVPKGKLPQPHQDLEIAFGQLQPDTQLEPITLLDTIPKLLILNQVPVRVWLLETKKIQKLPPLEAEDPSMTFFYDLSQRKYDQVCSTVLQLIQNIQNLNVPLVYGLDRFDSLAQHIQKTLDQIESLIDESEEDTHKFMNGCESYLLITCYDSIMDKLKTEDQKDEVLSRHVSMLRLYGYQSLLELPDMSKDILKQSSMHLLRFQASRTPLVKIQHLLRMQQSIVDQLPKTCSADDLVTLMIYSVIETQPYKLMTSIRWTKTLRSSKRINGHEAYAVVNLEAAVSFILSNIDHAPQELRPLLEMKSIQKPKKSPSLLPGLDIFSNLEQLAKETSNKIWNFSIKKKK
ncbi:hypothetical protein EDD86DRAFT_202265, partial [Gorgonomyces haynaldii]